MRVQLFDASNIDALSWPSNDEGIRMKSYLTPLVKEGVSAYFNNIKTQLLILTIDGLVLPITVNNDVYTNSFVCSLYGHYVLLGQDSIVDMRNKLIRNCTLCLIRGLGRLLKWGHIDMTVIVNNWLFSTDLYPPLSTEQIATIQQFLLSHFPDRAIVFRSIHTYCDKVLYRALQKNGFSFIASRQIFFIDPKKEDSFISRAFKSDLKLMSETSYTLSEDASICLENIARIKKLYDIVYLDKHSRANPQLNERFIKLIIDTQHMHLKAVHKNGQVDAIGAYSFRNGVMTSHFVGYDTSNCHAKLYRLASGDLILESKKRGLLFDLSGGGTFYKTIRKAEPTMEYFAVYYRHLPFLRRFPWYILKSAANMIGVIFMRNYDK